MGTNLAEVVADLQQARDGLLAESQQSASQGDWLRAKNLLGLAERADRLRDDVTVLVSGTVLNSETNADEAARPPEFKPQPGPVTTEGPDGYPRYWVRDDALIKQGRQRDGVNVYEHAVPLERYNEILDRLAEKASAPNKGRRFSIEQIQHKLDCPRYMTYVVVAMLVHEGILERARKGSYTFKTPATFRADAEALWNHLKGAAEL